MPKILAIDDINDNLISLKAIIEDTFPDSVVFTALNGPKGIELASANNPDVILLDIIMPGMDGFEVCRRLKMDEQIRDIPVVFLTALKGDKENRIKALEVGAEGFLSKPIDETELTAQIRAMVKIKVANDQKREEKEWLEKLVEERTYSLQNELKERKKTEKSLRESEERFQMLFNQAPLGYQSLDIDGHFIEVNKQWLDTLGFSREEVIGKWFGDFLSSDYKEGFRKRFPLFKAQGHIHSEFEMVHKNGSKLFIAFEGKIGYNLGGGFKQTHCILQDITQSKKAEKALQESEEKYRTMVDLLPDGVIIHEGGKLVFANAAAIKTVGADSFEQLIERSLLDYVHPDYRTFSLNRIKEIYSTGQASSFSEEKFITLKDEILDVEVIGIPVMYMGSPAIQTIIKDITQRKKSEETLQKSEERAHKQRAAIAKLLLDESIVATEMSAAVNRITEVIANTIDVERASIWMFSENENELKCLSLFEAGKAKHSHGFVLYAKNYPNYFKAIHTENLIDADDAQADHRTNEFTEGYLKQLNITSMLDAKVQLEGRILGVVCLEHLGEVRKWQSDEKAFVNNVATIISQVFTDKKRKQAEEKLTLSEDRFRNIFNISPDSVAISEIETGRYVEVNSSFEKLSGFNKEELIGKTSRELGIWIDNRQRETYIGILKSEGEINNLEITFRKKDGSLVDTLASSRIIEASGKLLILNVIKDITERKLAQEAIRISEAKFREFFEKAADAIFIADIDTGIILDVNEAASRLMDRPYAQLVGIHQTQLHPPVKKDYTKDSFKKHKELIKQKINSHAIENTVLRADGTEVPVEILASEVDYHGKRCMMGTFRDITDRKKSEKEIQESEAKYRYMFQHNPQPMWIYDHDSLEILEVNNASTKIYGYSREEFLSMTLKDIRPAEDVPLLLKDVEASRMDENSIGEWRHLKKSGEIMDVEISASSIKFNGREARHVLIKDITERKVAVELLRESEYFFRESQRAAFVGSYKFNIKGDYWTSSEVLDQIFGIDKNYSKSLQSWIKIVHPEDREMMVQYFSEEVVGKRQTFNKEYRIISQKDNETRWVLGLGKLKLDAEDHVVEMMGTIQDITERVLAQQALNEKTQLFQELFNASPDAILLIDPHHPKLPWTIVDCNIAACRMNGYAREELIGKSIDLINTQDGTPEVRQIYLRNIRQKGIIHGDFIHRKKDGQIFPVETSTSLICIGGRELILGIDRDITERKQAEQTIKESEERYRSFISQVSEGVYRFESDKPMDISLPIEEQIDFVYDHFTLAECNQAFLMMYGCTNEQEILGKKSLDFHGGRNNPINRETFRTFINNGYRTQNAITQETNSLGQAIYFTNNSLGIIENEKLIRLWGTQTDVTEKIRADQIQQVLFSISNAAISSISMPELIELISKEVGKLLDSTNFYIAFYDEETDMLSTIFERDEKDVIETWPAENSITGYVIKQQKSILLREEDVDQLYRDSGIKQFGTPAKVWLGVPLLTNKKTIGAIVVQSYENPDAYSEKDKQMLEFISNQISISIERKQAQAEIIEKELQYRNLADSGMALIWTADTDKLCKYFNEPWLKFTGRTFEQEYGYGWVEGVHPDDLDHCVKTYDAAFDKRESFEMEYRLRHFSGEYRWLLDLGKPNYNSEGKFIGYIGHCFDITDMHQIQIDLRNAKEKAEESDRLKSSFLANMSHEIRTPLNSIIGFSELLLDEDFEQGQHVEFARTINASGNSLLTIISDIMDFSKIEAGQIQIYKKSFSVNNLINELQKEYNYIATDKGIELRLDPTNPEDEIFIQSDEQRIRQILINFVGNAIKFTEKGYIEIGFGIESDRDKACLVSTIQFSVKDTGIGIPEEYHQQIFERFRQVETAHTRKYGGNGLGLAISKNLVELLGGQIGMDSEKGKGSTFYFTVPLT